MNSPEKIYLYDLRYIEELDRENLPELHQVWDECHIISALQGIVNREKPQLYVIAIKHPQASDRYIDEYWLDYLKKDGHWLANTEVVKLESLDALLTQFRSEFRGLVVYDTNVPATSNLASTIAGVDRLLPIRFDLIEGSLYEKLVYETKLPILMKLINDDGSPVFTGEGKLPGTDKPSSGSAKVDCYLWAVEKYIKTGLCNPRKLGYYIDSGWMQNPLASTVWNHTLTNHDYFIAQKGFFFDLSPWDDETPNDDPMQMMGMDRQGFQKVMSACYKATNGRKMLHVGGFIPWAFKYTDYEQVGGTHGGVSTEWEMVKLVSAYNGYIDADALGYGAMANASFFQYFPLKESYSQNPKPTIKQLKQQGVMQWNGIIKDKKFFTFYVGDYDSAAWMYMKLPELWDDPQRGKLPMAWAFNPNLAERMPVVFDYVHSTKSPNDYFVSGDSGAGYLNPGMLCEPREISGLPSGLETWKRHCKRWYKKFDLSITGFVIDGHAPGMSEAGFDIYSEFSPDGLVGFKLPNDAKPGIHKDMPYLRITQDIGGTPEEAANSIHAQFLQKSIQFGYFRAVLQTPGWLVQVVELLKSQYPDEHYEYLEPHAFFLLMKRQLLQEQGKAEPND